MRCPKGLPSGAAAAGEEHQTTVAEPETDTVCANVDKLKFTTISESGGGRNNAVRTQNQIRRCPEPVSHAETPMRGIQISWT